MKKIIFCLLTFIASFAVFSGDYSALKFRFTEDIETFQGEVPEEYEKLTLYENLEKIELLAEKEVVIDGSQIQKITIEENNFISVSVKDICLYMIYVIYQISNNKANDIYKFLKIIQFLNI